VEFTGVKKFRRPWGWLRSLRRSPRRTYLVRPRWRGWTPGVVLQKKFTWAPSTPGLKLRHLLPRRYRTRFEVPGPGPFRQRAQFFRRRRRRRSRRKVRWLATHQGPRLSPPEGPPLIDGLPPRGYAHHWTFWGLRRRARNRGLLWNPNRRGDRRGARRRRRRALRGRPGGVHVSFRQDYLRGLSYLMVPATRVVTLRAIPRGISRNRINLGVRSSRRGGPSYLNPRVGTPPAGASFYFTSPRGVPTLPSGWTPRRGRPRRLSAPAAGVTPPGVETLLEGTAQFVGARYRYRRGRTTRVARRRRRIQLVTRGERRGWMFRLPHRKSRGFNLELESRYRAVFVRADLKRVARRRHRRDLSFRKRRRSNRVRHARRKRKKRVPRRVWKLLRRVGRRARLRWGPARVGPLGLNRRARGRTLHRGNPFFRLPWWVPRQFRPRLPTRRKLQINLLRRRRGRQLVRASWVGLRGKPRPRRRIRRYLRGRPRRLNRRRRRGRRRRGRLPRGVVRTKATTWATEKATPHLGRWWGLFTRRGQSFPREGREVIRSTRGTTLAGLFYLFHTPLGSRTRRRGGALLKVPSLLQPRQSWSQVRRWFTRGVSTRGDRDWTARVVQELISPVGVARAREEFIRGALFNRALL